MILVSDSAFAFSSIFTFTFTFTIAFTPSSAATIQHLAVRVDSNLATFDCMDGRVINSVLKGLFSRDGGNIGLIDLEMDGNPVKDDTYIFVPYCTQDIHFGNASRTYPRVRKDGTLSYSQRTSRAVICPSCGTFTDLRL